MIANPDATVTKEKEFLWVSELVFEGWVVVD